MPDSEARTDEAQGPGATAQQSYWAGLYEQCHEEVRRYFARHVRCPHDVEDLVQNVFANLITYGGRLRDPHTYVRAVARHQLCAYWRRKSTSVVIKRIVSFYEDDLPANGSPCDYESDPLNQLAKREIRQTVALMMCHLSPALAEVARLRFVDGLPPEETALRTGCSREALHKRLTRARQSLVRLYRERKSIRACKTGCRGSVVYANGRTEGR